MNTSHLCKADIGIMKMRNLVGALPLLAFIILLTLSSSLNADTCRRTMGPYELISQAESAAQEFRNAGYETSGIWGEGGIVSSWSNRRYYFNIFYPC